MNKQIKKLMSELRKEGYMNQLEELFEAVLSGEEEAIKEEIDSSLYLLKEN